MHTARPIIKTSQLLCALVLRVAGGYEVSPLVCYVATNDELQPREVRGKGDHVNAL
jgi:hypothetical protein